MRTAFCAAISIVMACTKESPPPPSPVQAVSVAPQTTGSPNEPALLLGTPKGGEPGGDVQRVKIADDEPDAAWRPPKDRCPEGITEMISVHVPLGQTMGLAPGARPVSARGTDADSADVIYDRGKRTVQVVARKYGLVFVTVERDSKCTLYGINTGY